MTTLITGGNGFIGLAIAERLIADGEKVILFDQSAPDNTMLARPELAGATVITGDIRHTGDVEGALAAQNIDRVIHTAAITPNQQRERDEPGEIVEVNVGGTVNLMERILPLPAIKRIVILSSVAVYGFSKPAASGLFEEQASPPAPASLYGITKLAAEQAALRIGQLHERDVRVVRLGPTFGVWENSTAARDTLSPHYQVVRMAMNDQEILLSRPMTADWIYARDAAEAIGRISSAAVLHHPIYHVSGAILSDLTRWCGIVRKLVPGLRWKLVPDQLGNVITTLPQDRAPLDIARLQADTGFRPSHSLDVAAREYLAWINADPQTVAIDRQGQP
jgi:nucleoside-diphosphate-sugar epimerase